MPRQRLRVLACAAAMSIATLANLAAVELPRVRPVDDCATSLLELARLQSSTVRALEASLAPRDVVAYVACEWRKAGQPDASLRWVSRTPQFRYVVLTIGLDLSLGRRIELLGHELHHANDVADAAWVRCERDLGSFFGEIGRRTSRSATFETEGAKGVELQVRHEIYAGAAQGGHAISAKPR
jgi:hypothetical protein